MRAKMAMLAALAMGTVLILACAAFALIRSSH